MRVKGQDIGRAMRSLDREGEDFGNVRGISVDSRGELCALDDFVEGDVVVEEQTCAGRVD